MSVPENCGTVGVRRDSAQPCRGWAEGNQEMGEKLDKQGGYKRGIDAPSLSVFLCSYGAWGEKGEGWVFCSRLVDCSLAAAAAVITDVV